MFRQSHRQDFVVRWDLKLCPKVEWTIDCSMLLGLQLYSLVGLETVLCGSELPCQVGPQVMF